MRFARRPSCCSGRAIEPVGSADGLGGQSGAIDHSGTCATPHHLRGQPCPGMGAPLATRFGPGAAGHIPVTVRPAKKHSSTTSRPPPRPLRHSRPAPPAQLCLLKKNYRLCCTANTVVCALVKTSVQSREGGESLDPSLTGAQPFRVFFFFFALPPPPPPPSDCRRLAFGFFCWRRLQAGPSSSADWLRGRRAGRVGEGR